MVSKWKAHNPLSIQERHLIKEGIDMNMSYREIGLHVGREKSVVMKEAKRLGLVSEYDPEEAQKDFEYKQTLIGKKKGVQWK